ncbi:hypothetical protein [uncultured Shewanella sp.]|uniref:hypothetical protein n=1 Tax=uncultured Shewanella sp. TaxID=173975 RepID=UPI0026054F41|nr:hypothetical protein [uncultured Shewanella sp.]
MQTKLYQYGQQVMAILIIISVILHWEILAGVSMTSLSAAYNLVAIPWFILSVCTAWALWLKHIWGFWLLYFSLIYSTVALSIPIIPFITNLFPLTARPWIMISLNITVLLINIWLHMKHKTIKNSLHGGNNQ